MIAPDVQKRLAQKKHLIDMAAGRVPVDLLLVNGRIVDVFTQTVVDRPLAVGDGKILGIGDYQAKDIIDVGGRYLLPGLIDAHVHIESSMLVPQQFARAVVVHGTTAVIADPHEIANVLGVEGISFMLDNSQNLDVTILYMLPSCVPASDFECSGATLQSADLARFLDHELVLGIGEVMDFPGVVAGTGHLLAKIVAGEMVGRVVDGHAPGLSGIELNGYAAAGVRTDHECVSQEELLERVRRGMYVHIREGTAARNLEALVQNLSYAASRRCTFCTDDREAHDIVQRGHINSLLRLAVSCGVNPVTAVTMATLNPAECYGLHHKGALSPGRDADIVVVDDLVGFNVHAVYTAGRTVVRGGALVNTDERDHLITLGNSVRTQPINESLFHLPLSSVKAQVISIVPGSLVTYNRIMDVVADSLGLFQAAENPGLNKIAVIERHRGSGQVGVGLLHNFSLQGGAIATTVAHDAHNIVVAGDNDRDMMVATERLGQSGGGIVLVKNGSVLGELVLPIGGLMCDRPVGEVAERLEELTMLAHQELSVNNRLEPFMTLSFMSLSVIPELKITASGLLDVRKRCLIAVSV